MLFNNSYYNQARYNQFFSLSKSKRSAMAVYDSTITTIKQPPPSCTVRKSASVTALRHLQAPSSLPACSSEHFVCQAPAQLNAPHVCTGQMSTFSLHQQSQNIQRTQINRQSLDGRDLSQSRQIRPTWTTTCSQRCFSSPVVTASDAAIAGGGLV